MIPPRFRKGSCGFEKDSPSDLDQPMDPLTGLLGGPWLTACSTARPKRLLSDDDEIVKFSDAPADQKMRAAVLHGYGDTSEIFVQKIYLPLELVRSGPMIIRHRSGTRPAQSCSVPVCVPVFSTP